MIELKIKKLNFLLKFKISYLFIISIFLIFILYVISIRLHLYRNNSKISSSLIDKESQNREKKFKIIAISYSNNLYQRQLKLNKKSAIEVGKVDEYYSYGPEDIDKEFKEKNIDILSRKRGNGYWLWKSYIINKTIVEKLKDGDYLIYTDACTLYMDSVFLLLKFLKSHKISMWIDRVGYKEFRYTKRDAFILLGADMPFYSQTNQYQATIQIYKKSTYTVKFIQEWLYYCQDKRIITDDKNTLNQPNFKGFKDNRHDQSVLSLLIKKYGELNSGFTNLNISDLIKRKKIFNQKIICIYRRMHFKNYTDLKNKCKRRMRLRK